MRSARSVPAPEVSDDDAAGSGPADAPAGSDSIRAVVRALRLLRLMNTRHSWTLHALHQSSGLPKATLSRLLGTLREEGYVVAEAAAGSYRLSAKVRELDGGYSESSRLVDAGRAILLRVTRQIKWPLALGILDVDAIVVRFSSMPYSPLAVHTTTLGHRHGLFDSAMGRVYLAFCSEAERLSLFEHFEAVHPAAASDSRAWIERDLDQVRLAGHAVRQPSAERGSATLAVPVLVGGEAMAALSMTTFGKSMTPVTIERHLPVLRDTAQALGRAFGASV